MYSPKIFPFDNALFFCILLVVTLQNTNVSAEPYRIIHTVAGKVACYSFEVYQLYFHSCLWLIALSVFALNLRYRKEKAA